MKKKKPHSLTKRYIRLISFQSLASTHTLLANYTGLCGCSNWNRVTKLSLLDLPLILIDLKTPTQIICIQIGVTHK